MVKNFSGALAAVRNLNLVNGEGIGFAVPINIVKPIINSFIEKHSFIEVSLGIYAYDKNVIPYLDSNVSFNSGIYVAQIIKNTLTIR